MASRCPTRAEPPPVAARLLTATLFIGCLPHALMRGRGVGETLESARDAIAHVYGLPG